MVAHKDCETAHDNFGESIVESRQQISLSVTIPCLLCRKPPQHPKAPSIAPLKDASQGSLRPQGRLQGTCYSAFSEPTL